MGVFLVTRDMCMPYPNLVNLVIWIKLLTEKRIQNPVML